MTQKDITGSEDNTSKNDQDMVNVSKIPSTTAHMNISDESVVTNKESVSTKIIIPRFSQI